MQAKTSIIPLLLLTAVLVAGCAGAGQPDSGATAVTNASKDLYAGEFRQGFAHHTSASDLFNNATTLWNADDYTAASGLLERARGEYAQAEGHYHNMASYAGSADELGFAQAMEESAIDMDEASSRYLLSIASAENDTASAVYFEEGQELVDRSIMTLNRSLDLMPSYLDQTTDNAN